MASIILKESGIVIGNPEFFRIETLGSIFIRYSLGKIMPNEVETKNRFTVVSETMVNVKSTLSFVSGDLQEEIVFFNEDIAIPSQREETPFSVSPVFIDMSAKLQKRFSQRISRIHEAIAQKTIVIQNKEFSESNPSQDAIIRCDEQIERQQRNLGIMLKKRQTNLTQELVSLIELRGHLENILNSKERAIEMLESLLTGINNSFDII